MKFFTNGECYQEPCQPKGQEPGQEFPAVIPVRDGEDLGKGPGRVDARGWAFGCPGRAVSTKSKTTPLPGTSTSPCHQEACRAASAPLCHVHLCWTQRGRTRKGLGWSRRTCCSRRGVLSHVLIRASPSTPWFLGPFQTGDCGNGLKPAFVKRTRLLPP